jgi:hypothetical protein
MSSHRRVRRQFRIRTLTIAVAVLAVVAVGLPVASAQLPSDLTDGATSAGLDPSALDQVPTDRSPGLDPGTGAAAAGIAAAGIGAAGIGAAEVGATQPDPDTAEDVASSVEGTGQALAAGAADPPPDESAPLYQVTSGGQAETVDREQAFPAGATTDDTSGQDQAQDKQANRICGPRQINGKVDIFCWNEGETPPGEPVDTTPPPVPAPPAPVAPACPFTVGDSDGNCVPDAQDPDWVDPATGIRNWDNPDWRDDDLDTIPNSRDPYPNGECVPDTTQDADCDGIRNTADRDRLRAAGNTEMVRQWECSEYKLARDCDLNWVDPLTNPQRDRDGDDIADHMDPRDDRRPMPTQAPPTPAPTPAPEEVAPTPVGGSLGVRPSQMPALIEFGAIRRAVDELFETPSVRSPASPSMRRRASWRLCGWPWTACEVSTTCVNVIWRPTASSSAPSTVSRAGPCSPTVCRPSATWSCWTVA